MLIFVNVTVLITRTLFVNSHPLHTTLLSKLYSVCSHYLFMDTLLYQLHLKGCREVCQLEGTVELTLLHQHISAKLSCLRSSLLCVMDCSCHCFSMFYCPLSSGGYFKIHNIDLFTLVCCWCFMRLYRSFVKSSYLPMLSFLLIPLRPLFAELSSKGENESWQCLCTLSSRVSVWPCT